MATKPQYITSAQVKSIVAATSDTHITAAYAKLGPIQAYSDLLDNTSLVDPTVCLASEQIIHMAESWRYLASAMYAFLNNEHGNAIHLAYYAELRAALSLFSGSGLRIDMLKGFWIDSTGARKVLPNHKTHKLAWEAWGEWVKRPDAQSLIRSQIKILPNVSLGDIQPELPLFSPGAILSSWGFDLINLQDDHYSRNTASYNAYWRNKPLQKMTEENLEFVREFSELFLSAGSSGLMFDKALIQYLVDQTISVYDSPLTTNEYEKRKARRLLDISTNVAKQTGAEPSSLYVNLDANIGKKIFDRASKKSNHAENVLARAGFMARLAMLSVETKLSTSSNKSAQAWIANWLENCGRWVPSPGVLIKDLEIDFIDAIENLPTGSASLPADLWRNNNIISTFTIANIHSCIAWGVAI